MLILLLQVCSVFYLATNTKGTLRGFFFIYSATSTHPYFLLYVLWQFLEGSQKQFIQSPFNLCCTPVNRYLYSYKNSFDSSKDRLDTKILSQFSKLQDKKPCDVTLPVCLYTQVLLICAFFFFFWKQLFWRQACPERMCTNGTQVPCEVPSLPNPSTRKGWPHNLGLQPLLLSKSDMGSFTSPKNKSVKVLWDRTYGFSSLSEKTRKSNNLQMSLKSRTFFSVI